MDRPPAHRALAYYLFGTRVPYHCRYWVREDVLRPWYLTRDAVRGLTFWSAFYGVAMPLMVPLALIPVEGEYHHLSPHWSTLVVPVALITLIALLELLFPAVAGPLRRRMLHRHDFHEDGTPICYPLPADQAWNPS